MNTDVVLTLGLLIGSYALVSGLVKVSPITPAMMFVAVGLLIGPHVLDIINVQLDSHGFQALAELALTLILFLQATRIDLRKTFGRTKARRLISVGLPLAMAIGTGVALIVFPELSFWEAAILGIIIVPTEVALVEPVFTDRRVPKPIRNALSLESGLGDGIVLGILLIALALASNETEGNLGHWLSFMSKGVTMSLAIGGAMGLVGGKLLDSGKKAGRVTESWSELYMIALAVLTYVVVEHLDGSGFVGAFGAGLVLAAVVGGTVERESDTAEAIGHGLELVVFALFGAMVVWPAFDDVGVKVLLYAVLSLVVVRVVAVAIAMAGTGYSRATKLYVGWFGPRGIATLLFAFLVLDEGNLGHIGLLKDVVFVTVTLSIFLQGITSKWGVDRYAAAVERLRQAHPDAPELETAAEGPVD
ncbi:MAG: cation:proton antiporter [Solirubrobacterales bacterium]